MHSSIDKFFLNQSINIWNSLWMMENIYSRIQRCETDKIYIIGIFFVWLVLGLVSCKSNYAAILHAVFSATIKNHQFHQFFPLFSVKSISKLYFFFSRNVFNSFFVRIFNIFSTMSSQSSTKSVGISAHLFVLHFIFSLEITNTNPFGEFFYFHSVQLHTYIL